MSWVLGNDCKFYVKVDGIDAGGSWLEVVAMDDIDLPLEANEAEVPIRGAKYDRQVVTTLKASIDLNIVWDMARPSFVAIKDAFFDKAILGVKVEDDDGNAWIHDCQVFAFKVSQKRKESVMVAVTLKPTYSDAAVTEP